MANNDVEEVDMWEESYGGHQDSKPKGPTSVAVDFTFAGRSPSILLNFYQIPFPQGQTMFMVYLNMQIHFH